MYSRSFFTDEKGTPSPPENYSGTAISEERDDIPYPEDSEETATRCDECTEPHFKSGPNERGGIFSGIFSDSSPISRLFKGGGVKSFISGIGVEEILIIATAMFLLFSAEGDKECAIMLLLLLVV